MSTPRKSRPAGESGAANDVTGSDTPRITARHGWRYWLPTRRDIAAAAITYATVYSLLVVIA